MPLCNVSLSVSLVEDISKFLVDNWQPLLSAVLSVLAVIIVLIKKKPDANSLIHYIEFICNSLPGYINEAEKTGLTGSRKFSDVLGKCMTSLHKMVTCTEQDDLMASKIFKSQIEAILSTPQKKG